VINGVLDEAIEKVSDIKKETIADPPKINFSTFLSSSNFSNSRLP
jgi:hypothetical protein